MKIAVISDIHDNFHNTILLLKELRQKKIKQIILLGDFIGTGIAKILADSPIPIRAIWGNNEGDKGEIIRISLKEKSNLTIGDNSYDFLEFDNRKIFITHYPNLAKPMAQSGLFDAVFYGHNHIKKEELVDKCLIANPGEISAHRTGISTYLIYDTNKNSINFFDLKNFVTWKTKVVDDYNKK